MPGRKSAVVLEVTFVECRPGPHGRLLFAVLGAGVATLAVHHHRAGQHQRIDAALVHRGEKSRGAEVVVAGVQRQIGDRDTGAHHRGLVTHDVDAVEQVGPVTRLTYVEPVDVRRDIHGGPVRLGDQRVHPDDLVTPAVSCSSIWAPMKPLAPVSRTFTLCSSPGSRELEGQGHVLEPVGAATVPGLVGSAATTSPSRLLESTDVPLEQREDLRLVDRLLGADPGVEVRDQRDRGVAEAELAGQYGFGVAGHVDDRPSGLRIALRLRAGGEPRALDHDHGPAVQSIRAGCAMSAARR